MKKLLVASLVFTSLSSFASVYGVGSFAEYRTIKGNKIKTSRIEVTLIDMNTSMVVKATSNVDGKTTEENETYSPEDFNGKEELEAIVNFCEDQDYGKSEVVTVPAGTFNTCKVVTEDGEVVNMAVVPFGYVKAVSAEGWIAELTDAEFKD